MSTRERWLDLVREIREGAVARDRSQVARGMYIDHYDEFTHPVTHDKGRGNGFAIFLGEYRIGWFETRAEACQAAEKIEYAIKNYPVDVGTGDA